MKITKLISLFLLIAMLACAFAEPGAKIKSDKTKTTIKETTFNSHRRMMKNPF